MVDGILVTNEAVANFIIKYYFNSEIESLNEEKLNHLVYLMWGKHYIKFKKSLTPEHIKLRLKDKNITGYFNAPILGDSILIMPHYRTMDYLEKLIYDYGNLPIEELNYICNATSIAVLRGISSKPDVKLLKIRDKAYI